MSSVFSTPFVTPILRALARTALRVSGWKVDIHERLDPPFVFIGAPHTSNWDFALLIAALLDLRLDAHWMGKHTLFRFPCGGLMRWLGGIAVDRRAPHNVVAATVAAFKANPGLIVCVPPEGTRRKVERWRTGFYFIAHGADVPIVMTVIDAEHKRIGLLGIYRPSGNIDYDLPLIQHHYHDFHGLRPENACDFNKLRGNLGPDSAPP
jgi:1-acyl-sn-glycerol-3-phosphate acyltransferase